MVIKKIIYLLLFFILLSPVFAQPAEFFMELRFVQRLTWSGDAYALRYEILIEREVNGTFRPFVQEFTTSFYIEVSLSAGRYRYQVFPYDFLEQRGSGSGWIEFEVIPALNPVLDYFTPELDITETDGDIIVNRYLMNIYGRNMAQNAQIYLRRTDGVIFIPDKMEISHDGSIVRLAFEDPYSVPENFEIIVINPGGLEAIMSGSSDIPPPPVPPPPPLKYFDFYFGAALAPKIFMHVNLNRLSEQLIALPGAMLRFGAVYRLLDFAKFGVEASAGWYFYDNDLQTVIADICLLVQKHISNGDAPAKFAFSFRLGAGYTFLIGDKPEQNWQPVHINTGGSFLWLPLKHLYLEAGIDLVFWSMNKDGTSGLRPFIGAGLRF